MTLDERAAEDARRRERLRQATPPSPGLFLLVGIALVALVGRFGFEAGGSHEATQTWSTIFVAIVLQAIPFLVLGVVLAAAISAFVPEGAIEARLPRHPVLAVPVAGLAGMALPGCECASVPVAGRMIASGVSPPAALSFLLSAPAANPVVLVATAVAFPQAPSMVWARLVASLALAMTMGWLWSRFGRPDWLRPPRRVHAHGSSRWETFRLTAQFDFLQAGGFLVVGAMFAATLDTAVDPAWTSAAGADPVVSVVVLALLAVLLAVCSEADAFVVSGLTGFSMTAKLVFMVVGPAVDVKLIAMQAGTFGRRFAARFAPVTFLAAVAISTLVAGLLL
ncbi:MAG TPA: permease [Pseudonocardia sp.]